MKKLAIQLSLVLFLSSMLIVGCKKYEDGPGLSFRNKRERAINTWKAKYALRDEVDATAWYNDWTLDMREDGRIEITTLDDNDSTLTQHGFWDLVNDNEEIRFQYTVPVQVEDVNTVTILRLKEDELWFRDVTDSATWEFRLIPADSAPADSTN